VPTLNFLPLYTDSKSPLLHKPQYMGPQGTALVALILLLWALVIRSLWAFVSPLFRRQDAAPNKGKQKAAPARTFLSSGGNKHYDDKDKKKHPLTKGAGVKKAGYEQHGHRPDISPTSWACTLDAVGRCKRLVVTAPPHLRPARSPSPPLG